MMNKYLIGLLGLLICAACEREIPQSGYEGPALADVFGPLSNVEPLDITNREVNFEAGETTTFTALFNKNISWEVVVTGRESGAVKSISGFSAELNTANATWNGGTTALPLFKEEMCDVQLNVYKTIARNEVVLDFSDSLSTLSLTVFDALVIADFENGIDPGWGAFLQSGGNMSYNAANDFPAGQGGQYLDVGGQVDWDWLILYVDFPGDVVDTTGGNYYPLSDNSSDVYFNVFVNIPEAAAGEKFLLFEFQEDDNDDNQFSASSDDMYSLRIDGLEPGWQIVSVNYNDLIDFNFAGTTANGNALREPNKLWNIRLLVLSNFMADEPYYQAFIDFMTFTEGGPLLQ